MVQDSRPVTHPGDGDAPRPEQALIGRDAELVALRELLATHRLVTLTGPGGVGKTTLALAAVAVAADAGGHRTVTCELAEISAPDAVRHAVAGALGVVPRPHRALGRSLPPSEPGARSVVVLDNCEHVLDAAAAVVEELLEAGPHLRVLVTSREPLRLPREQVMDLHPLSVPLSATDPAARESPAVELFTQRARAARADFRLDESTLPGVVRLCRALDGVPLALEIAAARIRSLGLGDLVDRLEHSSTLLRAGTRRSPDRHRSMQAVVRWSYELLDPEERALFLTLSVFAGGCDLAAAITAGSMTGLDEEQAIDVLDGLVSKSLLVLTPTPQGARYRMLETLREFGLARLAEAGTLSAARHAHADHYAGLMTQMRAQGLAAWTVALAPILGEFDNVRGAVSWALAEDHEADRSFALLAPMWYVSLQHHPGEIADWTDRALARWPSREHPLWSEVAATAAQARATLREVEVARELANAAVEAPASPVGVALGWSVLATVGLDTSHGVTAALDLLDRADSAAADAGFEPLRCDLMGRRATVLAQGGRSEEALVAARRSLAMTGEHENVFEHAWAQHLIGLLLAREQPDAAGEWLQAALAESRHVGYPYGTSSSLRGLGVVDTLRGDLVGAARHFLDAITAFERAGHLGERWNTVAAALPLLVAAGRREVAATLLVGIDRAGARVERIHAPQIDELRAELADDLGSATISARGEALGRGQLLDLARRELQRVHDEPAHTRADAPASASSGADLDSPAVFSRTGSVWSLTFDGLTVHLPDSKGLRDLAVLLARPGREVAALDLATPGDAPDTPQARLATSAHAEGLGSPGDLGDRLDAQARAAYKARIRELQEELDDADAAGDAERGARIQHELDFVTRELAGAYGLHGPRRVGDPVERARSTVTARIRSTITKLREAHPALATHLDRSVRTGRFCSYRPDPPTPWLVEP